MTLQVMENPSQSHGQEPNELIEECRSYSIDDTNPIEIEALKTFRQLNNSLLIPIDFTVPFDNLQWPKCTWGLNLGELWSLRTNSLLLQLEKSNSMELIHLRSEWSWDLIKISLILFKALNRHLNIPLSFQVPHDNIQWPPSTWKMPLGQYVHEFQQSNEITDQQKQELHDLGIHFTPVQQTDIEWSIKLNAFKIYREIHGDLFIPGKYIIPFSDPWPRSMHGLTLGRYVRNIRRKITSLSDKQRSELDQIGFIWRCHDYQWELKKKALEIYKKLNGNLLVPQIFNVPEKNSLWPSILWGYHLGRAVDKLRENANDLNIEKIKYLTKIGFIWRCRKKRKKNLNEKN